MFKEIIYHYPDKGSEADNSSKTSSDLSQPQHPSIAEHFSAAANYYDHKGMQMEADLLRKGVKSLRDLERKIKSRCKLK
jgi:hypothetical protein